MKTRVCRLVIVGCLLGLAFAGPSAGGVLQVSEAAAHEGVFGLESIYDGSFEACDLVQTHLDDIDRYELSFYIQPAADFEMARGEEHDVVRAFQTSGSGGAKLVFNVLMRGLGNNRKHLLKVETKDGNKTITVSKKRIKRSKWTFVKVGFAAASEGQADGEVEATIKKKSKSKTGLDNELVVDELRLGQVTGMDSGTSGSVYFDDVHARKIE